MNNVIKSDIIFEIKNMPEEKYVKGMFELLKDSYNATNDDYEIWQKNSFKDVNVILDLKDDIVIGYMQYQITNKKYIWCEVQIAKEYRHNGKTLKAIYNKFEIY